MKNLIQFAFLLLTCSLINACANYKTKYNKTAKDWVATALPNQPVEHQLFLIGDLKTEKQVISNTTLALLNNDLHKAGKNSSLLFLGTTNSKKKNHQNPIDLKHQLDLIQHFAGKSYFISGNSNWETPNSFEYQYQKAINKNKNLKNKTSLLPKDACSGPNVKHLSETSVLIAINSQWYLENWDQQKGINENCEYRTRALFLRELMDKIKDNKEKNIILAMHHPLNSNGLYGGHYSAKTHLFPLSNINPNLLIPLPGIGSIAAFMDNSIANRQELRHPRYQELKESLIDISEKFSNVIFVSGKEHSLQYIEEEEQHFINSGALANQTAVALGKNASFAAGLRGYSKLNIYKNGEVWVDFWATSDEKGNDLDESKLVFRKKLKDALPSATDFPKQFPEYEQLLGQDSITRPIINAEDFKIHNQTFWGKLYTQEYLTEFKMPILDLAKEQGGLVAIGSGGGNQTNSIRLQSKAGKYYQLRSIKKVTDRFPGIIRKTFANELLKQQLTGGNPFSALVIAPMAASIKVLHTNPRIVYVPKQANLKGYNHLGGEVYLLEERATGDWSELKRFGNAEKLESINKVIKNKLKNGNTIIDQRLVLRSRLFDMLIGDWDRHSDQWRWARYDLENGQTLYKPLPRDRDQAYAKFDGIANTLANYTLPFPRAADKYDGNISKKETTWLNLQARFFDRFFLSKMNLKDWEEEAKFIQENLSDATIEKAFLNLPPFAYEKDGAQFIKWTKMRRDDLLKVARNYYQLLNKEVNIFGTHKDNLLVINRLNKNQSEVLVYEKSKNKGRKQLIFQRVFNTNTTKELRIYSLDGNDSFEINDNEKGGILLRLIGGHGTDIYQVNSTKKDVKIYDDETDNQLFVNEKAKKIPVVREAEQTFDYRHFDYNYMIPLPLIGSNPDDGLFFNLNLNWNTFGFKKKQVHHFTGYYALGSQAFRLSYKGDYFNTFGHWDTHLKAVAEVPRYVSNFHGLGNETTRDLSSYNRDFYRVQRTLFGLYPALKRRTDAGSTFSFGPTFEMIKIKNRAEHITNNNFENVRPAVFQKQYFAGSDLSFRFYNTDHAALPTQGLGFTAGMEWRSNTKDFDRQLLRLKSSLRFYVPFGRKDQLVFSSHIEGQHILGEYDFFQAATLGGVESLRGYAAQRFSGRTAFHQKLDLRIKIFDSENNVIPLSGGFTPGFDYGRVWVKDDPSDKWHYSYGGTIWIAPLDYIALSTGVFISEEANRLLVKIGFQFR